MLIGVVGAPNKGKSTLFSAATLVDAAIANYPFTTISPNRGISYVRAKCPHAALGLRGCAPKVGKCVEGTRFVPVELIDVPGLVPDAHKGKGLGNKFLDSVREADALIIVVDGSGKTDLHGNPCDQSQPLDDVEFLKNEIAMWMVSIIQRHPVRGVKENQHEVAAALSGLRINESMVARAAGVCGIALDDGLPDDEGLLRLARTLLDMRMPIAVAFNKIDLPGARENLAQALGDGRGGDGVFACSAAVELALRKAAKAGVISYSPGGNSFEALNEPDMRQVEALEKMRQFLAQNGGTGVQDTLDWIVYKKLSGIVVYPVEDEHRFANHKGDILPDAFLVRKGATAVELAGMVHSDFAQKFIGAIDVKRHVRIGASHELADGDVIKIVAGR